MGTSNSQEMGEMYDRPIFHYIVKDLWRLCLCSNCNVFSKKGLDKHIAQDNSTYFQGSCSGSYGKA